MKDKLNRENMMVTATRNGVEYFDISYNYLVRENLHEAGYVIVKQNEVHRPDLIAHRIYGDTRFWWVLMEYNGFMDMFNDLEEDVVVRYPEKNSLLKAIERASRKVQKAIKNNA